MFSELEPTLRGLTVSGAAAIGFDQSLGVLAQAVPGVNDAFLMQIAEKGGGWVVLLVVLFFYRRDWDRKLTDSNEARKEQTAAMNKQADASQAVAIALTQNTEVMRRAIAREHGERYDEERR